MLFQLRMSCDTLQLTGPVCLQLSQPLRYELCERIACGSFSIFCFYPPLKQITGSPTCCYWRCAILWLFNVLTPGCRCRPLPEVTHKVRDESTH